MKNRREKYVANSSANVHRGIKWRGVGARHRRATKDEEVSSKNQ